MNSYLSKYFGEIELNKVKQWYESEIELKGKSVEIVINISIATEIDREWIIAIDDYLENLQQHEEEIRQIMHRDLKKKSVTKEYIDILLEYHEKEDITELIKGTDKSLTKKERILSILYVSTINFFPETADDVFVVYDFTVDEELTDQLLVVVESKKQEISMKIES